MSALTILLATAGLAACAFSLLILHVASRRRLTFDVAARTDLATFDAADPPDEADTKPLLDARVARSGDNLGEQGA